VNKHFIYFILIDKKKLSSKIKKKESVQKLRSFWSTSGQKPNTEFPFKKISQTRSTICGESKKNYSNNTIERYVSVNDSQNNMPFRKFSGITHTIRRLDKSTHDQNQYYMEKQNRKFSNF